MRMLIPDRNRVTAGFSIWLQSLRKAQGDTAAAQAEQKVFLAGLEHRGMKLNEAGIPLDSPFAGAVLEQLGKWKREPHFQGTATLVFRLRPDATPGWEWFEIHPNPCSHPPLDLFRFECRADRMPGHRQWLHREFITEQCKESIERAGLTGLEFTWVCDVGRYQASQWYHAMATQPLWRGLNRPSLFDSNQPPGRIKTGLPTVDALVEIFNQRVNLQVFPQALRKFIPSTDFAFFNHFPGRPVASITMCCNARARDLLVQQGALAENEFVPFWIWDSPPEGAEVAELPDQPALLPYPLMEPEWRKIQEQVRLKRAAFLQNPKPPFASPRNVILAKFESLRKQQPPPPSNLTAKTSSTLDSDFAARNLPALWEQVLDISEDFMVFTHKNKSGMANGYEVIPRKELMDFNQRSQAWVEQAARKLGLPERRGAYLPFAHSDGDLLAFDTAGRSTDGDCRVVEWCHDPLSISREWPGIIQLLEDSLELEEADGSV